MIKRRLSIFLILSILITPIATAFSQCVEMDMPANQTMMSMADHESKQHTSQTSDVDCPSCSFHLTSSIPISSAYLVIHPTFGFAYNDFEYSAPRSTHASSLLRPPIANFT